MVSVRNPNNNLQIESYTSANQLLTKYMEKGSSQLAFARKRAGLNSWVRLLGAIMELKAAGDEEPYRRAIGGQ